MNWDALWSSSRVEFEELASDVRSHVPDLGVSVSRGPVSHVMPFLVNIEFGFPQRFNATPWGVELLIQLACGLADKLGLRGPDGRKIQLPHTRHQHAFRCELDRGNGELIASVQPIILPDGPSSREYQIAATDFVAESIEFCRQQRLLIIDELRRSS